MTKKTRSNYGISRIDQPDKKNHGFYVRITHSGTLNQRYFPDKASGGKNKALAAAKAYRDEVVKKLPKHKQDAINSRRKKIQQSDVTGVTHVVAKAAGSSKGYEYWQAAWDDSTGRRTAKFSISRYGNKEALDMAKKARAKGARGAAKNVVKKAAKKAVKKVTKKTAKKVTKKTAKKVAKKAAKKRGKKK